MLEVIEIDGKYYPLYDKEEWEASLREEAKEIGMEKGMEEGIEKGIEKGLEQGLEQGTINTKLSIAKTLKQKNFSTKEIMELTGLNQEEIKLL